MSYTEKELIEFLINSDNVMEILAIYYKNTEALKDYTMLVFDNKITKSINQKPPKDITNKLNSVKIVSTFKESFCIFNKEICYKMIHNIKADYEYKYCFNLDINTIKLLVDYHNGKKELETILSDLKLFKNDITCFPYMIENAKKLDDSYLEECVVKTLLIYNKLMRSNMQTFSSEYPYINTDYENVKETIDIMKGIACEKSAFNDYFDLQKSIYALLLKVSILSFENKRGIKCKLINLIEFVDMELGVFLEREIVLCYWFLKNQNDIRISKFFRGIQRNSKSILSTIQGMAWDLFHLRYCIEFEIAKDINNGTICMHYLVTQDNGLSDLADAYPIKFILFKKDAIVPKVIYRNSIDSELLEFNIMQDLEDNKEIRKETYRNRNIDKLIKTLEDELQKYIIAR